MFEERSTDVDLDNHPKSGVESVNRGGGSEREGGKGEKST